MRNRFFEKRGLTYKYGCNDWCCPCNDGVKGCYADDLTMELCDFDKLSSLLNECYDAMCQSNQSKDNSIYEDTCEKFFKHIDNFYENCPAYYKGYCNELDDGCFNPINCEIKLNLLS